MPSEPDSGEGVRDPGEEKAKQKEKKKPIKINTSSPWRLVSCLKSLWLRSEVAGWAQGLSAFVLGELPVWKELSSTSTEWINSGKLISSKKKEKS